MAEDDDDDFPRYSEPAEQTAQYVQPQPKRMSAQEFERAGGRYEEPQQQQPQSNIPRMSAQEFEQAGGKYEETTSGIGSAVRGFLHGVGPMGAAVATGAGVGTAIGGLPGTLVGGLAGLVTGAGAGYLQEKAVEAVAPGEAEAYRKAREEHPYLTLGGELAAAGPYFGVRAAGKLGEQLLTRSIAGGAGAGIDAAQQLALEDKFDPLRTLEAGAGSALLAGRPTRLGRALGVPGEHPVAQPTEAAAVPPAEPSTRAYPPAEATEPHTAVTEIPDAYQQGQYPREEWTGDKYGTREDYGARLEREFPQVKPEPHGTPGPETDTSVAQAPTPTAEPEATEFAATRAAKPGPEDYGKKTATGEGGAGVNVLKDGVDTTLAHAIEQKAPPPIPEEAATPPPTAAPPPAAAAAERPAEVLRGPEPAAAAAAVGDQLKAKQAERMAVEKTAPVATDKLPTRSVGDLHIEPNPAGGHVLMRGDEAISQHPTIGPAMIAMNRAAKEAGISTRQAMAREPLEFPKERMRPLAGAPTPDQFNARVTQRLYEDMKARYGPERADAWLAKQTPELPAGVTRLRSEPDMVRRDVTGRDRSGRPIKTEPLPIGTEQAILERGAEKATGPKLPPEQAPPEMQPARRQPAVIPEKVPLVEATESDKAQGLLSSLRRQFGALIMEPSASAQTAITALKKASGPLARLREQTASRFTNEMYQLANNMDRPGFERFVDAYERDQVRTLPKPQQELAGALKKNYDDFWKQVEKLPGAEKMEAVKDYLAHMYDNTNGQVDKFTSNWFGASGGSLRKRTYPTYADARAAGLTALSNNPIEHFTRYSEGLSHNLAQRGMVNDLKAQGRFAYFGPETVGASGTPSPLVKNAPPEGWSEIKAPWAQAGNKRGYAPRDAAETINQFYDAGLRRSQTKDVFEFARQTKNMWTAVELGLSAYHATTMSVETWNSGIGRALQIAATGDFARATTQLLKTPFEPYTNYIYGRDLRKIYRDPTGTLGDPLQRKIMDIFTQANIQPGRMGETSSSYLRAAADYDMGRLGNFWDAHKRGSLMNEINAQLQEIKDSYGLKIPKVALDNLRRAMATISKPLFQHYIPELKLGTMMKDMEAWLHANPNATDEAALRYASRVADSTDNRMGEMNYDNLFINKTAKDISMLLLRSFGFTVGGPIREIGGGAGRLGLTAVQGQNPLKHLDLRNEAADPRTAYALAFLPTIAAIGSAYQFMRTGKGPEDWRDLVTPQTGGMVKSVGQKVPERVLVPGYHKDFLGYFVNPKGALGELHAKLAAPWTTLLEQLTGEDWRDKPYVPPRASTLEWLQAHGKAALSHMAPIGPKQLAEGAKEGSALTVPEQLLGMRTPGAYMLNPKGYEAYRTRQQQQDWRGKERQEKLPPRPLPPSSYR